jgi:hypothetical protein
MARSRKICYSLRANAKDAPHGRIESAKSAGCLKTGATRKVFRYVGPAAAVALRRPRAAWAPRLSHLFPLAASAAHCPPGDLGAR